MKITLIANDTTFIYNLRREVLAKLVEEGHQVTVLCQFLSHREALEQIGCRLYDIPIGRRNTNPLADLRLLYNFFQMLKKINPDVVFTNNIKPNVYAGIACRVLGIKYIPNITGLGTPVENPGKLQFLATRLYKYGVAGADTIFFQNEENVRFFEQHNMMPKKAQICLLPGSGVNLQAHPELPYLPGDVVHFLFVARLLKEKGIELYAVLKGASLSACYYDPSVRALGDIDLLVPVQFVDRASELLISQGFHAPEDSFIHPYHIDFYKNSVVAELHYAVSTFPDSPAGAEAKRYMESWPEQLRQKHIENYTFQCLSDFHQALSLLLHMERHMTTSCIGLRQLCDWAAFLTSVMPDYFADQIVPELKRCGLKNFAGVLTRTAISYLGLHSAYGMPFQSIRERDVQSMIEEILRTGSIHNRNNTKDGSNFFVDESGTVSALQVFVTKINSLAQRKFPVTKKLPFLLPLFWLYIPLRYWVRSLAGKRRRKSLLRTIMITKQRKQLYRTLNLLRTLRKNEARIWTNLFVFYSVLRL